MQTLNTIELNWIVKLQTALYEPWFIRLVQEFSDRSLKLVFPVVCIIGLIARWQISKNFFNLYFLAEATTLILKACFQSPRPFWLSGEIKSLAGSAGFGMPSGHVTIVASILLLLAMKARRPTLTFLVVLLLLMVSFARVYLGVHFISDTIVGLLLAGLLAKLVEKTHLIALTSQTSTVGVLLTTIFYSAIIFVGGLVALYLCRNQSHNFLWRMHIAQNFEFVQLIPFLIGIWSVHIVCHLSTSESTYQFRASMKQRSLQCTVGCLGIFFLDSNEFKENLFKFFSDSATVSAIRISFFVFWTFLFVPWIVKQFLRSQQLESQTQLDR